MRPSNIDQTMAGRGYLPAQAAADAVGVHLSTIYRAIQSGHVTGQRCGRHWYATVESVVNYYQFPGLAEALAARLDETRSDNAPEIA